MVGVTRRGTGRMRAVRTLVTVILRKHSARVPRVRHPAVVFCDFLHRVVNDRRCRVV